MRKVSTESERADWISSWESSGESQSEWCKAQGLSLHTFRKWVGAHRKKEGEGAKVKFIPLEEEVIEHNHVLPLELTYPNGVQLRCCGKVSPNEVKAFLHLFDQ